EARALWCRSGRKTPPDRCARAAGSRRRGCRRATGCRALASPKTRNFRAWRRRRRRRAARDRGDAGRAPPRATSPLGRRLGPPPPEGSRRSPHSRKTAPKKRATRRNRGVRIHVDALKPPLVLSCCAKPAVDELSDPPSAVKQRRARTSSGAMTPAPRPPSAYRVLLGALLLASVVGAPPACSSSENCRDADCPSGHRCTDNVCSAPCTDQGDCELGQNCVTWGFVDGSQGQFCVALDYAANGKIGQYESCASDAACDTLRGFRCIDERCQLPCRSHSDCSAIGICQPRGGATGGVGVCVPQDPAPQPGGFGTRCPSGDECDADAGFVCVSAGVGDLDAYCTLAGCAGDDDCGPGHTCERVRSGRPPCEDACGFAGRPDAPDCVPADRIGASGDFSCGPVSLVQHLCVQRRFCAPCESDADCMAVPNQVCARDASGEKICTTLCDPDATSCPWGNASACAV